MNSSSKLPAHVLRELAVVAETDPRTVARYIGGKTVKALCAKRIERALRMRALDPSPGERASSAPEARAANNGGGR